MDSLNDILNLSNEKIIVILKDVSFRKHLFFECRPFEIRDFLKKLPSNLSGYLLDDECRNIIPASKEGYDIITIIMQEYKSIPFQIKYSFLNNPAVFEMIYHFASDISPSINFNGLNYLKYCIENHHNGISQFKNLTAAQKKVIIESPEGQELLITNNCLPYINLYDFKFEGIDKIFSLPNYFEYFLKLGSRKILEILSLKFDINFPNGFIENPRVINSILEYQNINILRLYLERIKDVRPNYYELLNKAIKKKQSKEIRDIDRDNYQLPTTTLLKSKFYSNPNTFSKYLDSIGLNLSCLKGLSKYNIDDTFDAYNTIYFRDILIDYFFEVSPYNLLKDLNEMLDYLALTNKDLIPNSRLSIYKKIANFSQLNWQERLELYQELLNLKDIKEDFYDDYKCIKTDSVNDINSHLISKEYILNNKNNSIDGIDVLELTGEPFGALINVTDTKRHEPVVHQVWYETSSTISTSLISNDCLNSINGFDNTFVVVGFNSLKEDRLIHAYHSDSFTEHLKGTNNVCRLLPFEELISQTKGYNELLLLQRDETRSDRLTDKDEMITPDFVVSYNEIGMADVEVAKEFNIPILLIYTDCYHYNDNYLEVSDTNNEYISIR